MGSLTNEQKIIPDEYLILLREHKQLCGDVERAADDLNDPAFTL